MGHRSGTLGFDDIVAALSRPDAYPVPPEEVTVIETHISAVFLAGDVAFKVKKPVTFPFLDFATLAQREHYCHEEVRLNADLAPGVYRAVVPVVFCDGRLRIGGDGGEIVDWAVAMDRLPANRMLDVMLSRGDLDNDMLRRLSGVLAEFHDRARRDEEVLAFGAPAAVRGLVEENFAETDRLLDSGPPPVLPGALHDLVEAWSLHFVHENAELFAARARSRVCDGHGDLHAGNICFRDGGVVVYDRIEFSDRFRCGDVANDLAFLLMDLDHRGYRRFADFLLRDYVGRSGDVGLLDVVDFYKVYRAWVRGKVAALHANQATGTVADAWRRDALAHFNLAGGYVVPPSLVVLCGLPGCGKSTVAAELVRALDAAVVNSDKTRKRLAGLRPTEARPAAVDEGLYRPASTDATYRAMVEAAAHELGRGRSVIIDAGCRRRSQRQLFRDLAVTTRVPGLLVHVAPPDGVIRERIEARLRRPGSESDADLTVLEAAHGRFETPSPDEGMPVLTTATRGFGEELTAAVVSRLLAAVEVASSDEEDA